MAVIWLHGLGDTSDGWASLQHEIIVPNLKVHWKFPEAPSAKVSCNGGAVMTSWFDISAIPLAGGGACEKGVAASVKSMHDMVDKLEKEMNIPPERVVIGGFSQGGLLAMHSVLTYPRKMAGAVAFSGWLSGLTVHESNAKTPVLWVHGQLDDIVPFDLYKTGIETLEKLEVPVRTETFRMGHTSAGDKQNQLLASFLQDTLAGQSAAGAETA